MDVSSLTHVKSNDHKQQLGILNKTANKENIIIICFNPNHRTNDLKKRLDQIKHHVIYHTELESCITFIQSIQKQKIFLITSSSRILTRIINLHQINSIFIFSLNYSQDTLLSLENSKVINIYNNADLLCSSIQEQINLSNKQIPTWCFFDQNENETKDLTKQSSNFLWFQLFHNAILHLSRDKQAKKQMFDACRHYYQDNLEELKLLDEFELKYEAKEALRWFMKSLFLQKIINKALQTEDTDLLYTLRYFIADLLENLAHQHQQTFRSKKEKLIVYREMKITSAEFIQMQKNKGQLVLMKGFLTANTDRSAALALSTPTEERSGFISVLFEIECNIKKQNDNLILADVTEFMELASEKVILFDFNTTFRLEDIQQDEPINGHWFSELVQKKFWRSSTPRRPPLAPPLEPMWVIKLNAVSDGRTILTKYIHDTHRQIEGLSIPIMFGKLLCDMNQWNQSQLYFEHLLNDSHGEDVAWIEHCIGQAHQWKGEWNEARKYYDHAYDQMMKNKPIRIKDSAIVLSDIGEILYLQGKYEEAYDFCQQALEIRKKYYSSNHPHIATGLDNIGLIHYRQSHNDQALDFFKQALTIREEYYHHFHIDIARSLENIGNVLKHQQKFDEALVFIQRAMSICEKHYPTSHVLLASIFNQIGCILPYKKKDDEAFSIIQHALTIQKRYYPFSHVDIATTLSNIGQITIRQLKYNETIELLQQALIIQKRYYLSGHLDMVRTLDTIGISTLHGTGDCDAAIDYHQQALTMLETFYPSYTARIALTLMCIGMSLGRQNKNDEALEIYHRALRMQQDYYLSDHIEMALVLSSIGNILCKQQKYNEANDFLHKALKMQQDYYLSDHMCMIFTLRNMGVISLIQEKYDDVINYHRRALTITEKSLPPCHMDIVVGLKSIGNAQLRLRKFDEALDHFQRALTTLEEFHPMKHTEIVQCLQLIAHILCEKTLYSRAIEYVEKCLRIKEASSSSNHSSLALTFASLGEIQRIQRQYELSLTYELKCFSIHEQVHPPNHQNIGKSLSNIGTCYEQLNQLKTALEYYKRALVIYEQCLPFEHVDRQNIMSKIEQLSI